MGANYTCIAGFEVNRRLIPSPSKASCQFPSVRVFQRLFDFPNSLVCILAEAVSRGYLIISQSDPNVRSIFYKGLLHDNIRLIPISQWKSIIATKRTFSISHLSHYSGASTSCSSQNQICFGSNWLNTTLLQIQSFEVAVSIEVDELGNECLKVFGP